MSRNQELVADTLIKRNEVKFLASALGEEIVMMNTDNGDYIGINSVGTDIWEVLSEPMRVDDLFNKILDLYSGSEADIRTDVDEFIKRALKLEMLVIPEPTN